MKISALFAVTVLFFGCLALPALSATYYIDKNHPSASDSNAGTSESLPWKTISKANSTLQAGDTVFIKAGDYPNNIYPARSGTAGNPITYKRFGTDVVNVKSTGAYGYGLRLDQRNYIVVEGINFTNLDYFLFIRGGSHNTVSYCTFDNPNLYKYTYTYSGQTIEHWQVRTWAGSRVAQYLSGTTQIPSQYNWIHHCTIANYGYYDSDDHGCCLDVGSESSTDQTRYNLFENCLFYHGGHHVVGVYGMQNVFRNNYFHNEPWSMGTPDSDRGVQLYGDRNLSIGGSPNYGGRNLFEGNRVGYSADSSDNWGSAGASMNSPRNIVRFNCFYYNDVEGLAMTVTSSYEQNILYNKIYNNTFFKNTNSTVNDPMMAGIGVAIYSGSLIIQNNALKNNLLYKHRKTYGEYNINTPDRKGLLALQIWANTYDGDALGNPQFINAPTTLGDPFDDATPDLRLQPTSPCKDYGTYLTKITTAGGTGSSFQVEDAGYFMDGWGVPNVEGDMIQLFGTGQKARITSVNYDTNWITLDRSVTWTQGQGVSLPYNGAAPDAGAHELDVVNPVAGFDVQKGSAGRGFVRYVDVTFQSAEGLDNLAADNRVKLTRYELNGSGGATVSLAGAVSVSGNQVSLNFGPKGLGGEPTSTVGDGYYVLAFDINGDGAFETERRFYRLLGDVDGDRKVTAVDANLILASYRQSGANLPTDVTGDGVVNALDRMLTIRSLNRKLADGLLIDD